MGMFDNDIIYGGEQLQPNVQISTADDVHEYVLWDAGIVARNVVTTLGADGVKAELVISQVVGKERDGTPTTSVPAKFGTFASSIVDKVSKKSDGDLPAVIKFEVIPAKDAAKQDAFVMAFVRRWDGAEPAADLPALSPFITGAADAPPIDTTVRESGGNLTVKIGDHIVQGDPTGADHPLDD